MFTITRQTNMKNSLALSSLRYCCVPNFAGSNKMCIVSGSLISLNTTAFSIQSLKDE